MFLFIQVQTDMTVVSETKFVTEIPNADDINHIVIFMTGAIPFPDGMGAAGLISFDYLL